MCSMPFLKWARASVRASARAGRALARSATANNTAVGSRLGRTGRPRIHKDRFLTRSLLAVGRSPVHTSTVRSIVGLAALALILAPLRSSSVAAEATHVVPLFSISKSENKNQVQYAIRVDDSCAPVGRAPVFAYWRMLERGPTQYEQLLPREEKAYGIASQVVATRSDSGGYVRL